MESTTARYTIRSKQYRGHDGYTVSGNGSGIFATRIFVETREAAEHVRMMLRKGQDIELVDFQGHDAGLSGYCTRCMGKVA